MQTVHTSCSAARLRFVLGQLPRLVLVDVLVHAVGQQHDLAQRLAELALVVQLLRWSALCARSAVEQRAALDADVGRQLARRSACSGSRRRGWRC